MSDPPTPTAYQQNVRDQYEALGEFVEAFERLVSEVRLSCIGHLRKDAASDDLIKIAFHHQALTAKPLFEIMRAIIAEELNRPSCPNYGERAEYKSLLGTIHNEYNDLANIRNNLLHGTWYIGVPTTEDPDASEFILYKYTTTKDGLARIDNLPKNAEQLHKLSTRCMHTGYWLGLVENCLAGSDKLSNLFKQVDKIWYLTVWDEPMPLPQKLLLPSA
jgi:hypothetical protein